jgi:hypothetical protein
MPMSFTPDKKIPNKNSNFSGDSFRQRLKPQSILALNAAGFGDMLWQISKFLWVSDYYGFRAKVFTDGINDRNEISISEFFDELNITSDNLLSNYFDFSRSLSFTRFLDTTKRFKNPLSTYYFQFDGKSYNTSFNPDLRKSFDIQHPRLLNALKKSNFYRQVIRTKETTQKTKICIHVRRGDTARVKVADARSIIKEKVNPDKFLYPQGVDLPFWMEKKVKASFLERYKKIDDYQTKLEEIVSGLTQPYEIILISDGMTKLAENLKQNFNYIFKDREITELDVENTLNAEFGKILTEVDRHWIGERETFWDSLIEAASSDIIISNSPAFIKYTTKGLGLNIKFVKP